MSRRTKADKRKILPEPKYSSQLLAKFINIVMKDGKIASAAPKPYGNGRTNCNPILTAKDANKNTRYPL